jgi:N-acetylglucosaminyldiphosphoundecaprenol N-acetyl-beta-D-mannosaminyltransferase
MPDIFFQSIRISSLSTLQIAERILLSDRDGQHFHFLAASTVVAANQNPNLVKILNDGISLCDSKPLSKFLDYFKTPFANVRGTDAFRETVLQSTISDLHYFIGTNDLTLNALYENLLSINPGFNLVGTCTANFLETYDESYAIVLKDLKIQKPSIVWIGLGSPKQDYLAEFISSEFPASIVAVGAAFDFIAGRKSEAPKLIQKFGLEWLFRLISEPRRLWKRYLIGNALFIFLCIKELMSMTIKGKSSTEH